MSIDLHFDEERREAIELDWARWWAGELPRPIVVIRSADQLLNANPKEFTRSFLLDTPVDEVLDHFQSRLEGIYHHADAMPTFFPNFGPGIVTGFLGGKVEPIVEQHTVWFEADEPVPFEDLHFRYDADNVWWRRIVELTAAAVQRWGDRVSIGYTDLGGIVDILASFRRTYQLLYDVYEAPEDVVRLAKDITRLWIRYYEELHDIIKKAGRGTTNWAAIWSPGRTYMHQCDFSYMISPEMFERFVLPDLDTCFRRMNHAFYHLDGKGAIRHLDMLLSMETLRGIQWIPGAGQPQASFWLDLLKRIKDGGKLCQVFVGTGGARHIVRELGGRGFALFIVTLEPMSAEEVGDFLRVLAAEDIDLI